MKRLTSADYLIKTATSASGEAARGALKGGLYGTAIGGTGSALLASLYALKKSKNIAAFRELLPNVLVGAGSLGGIAGGVVGAPVGAYTSVKKKKEKKNENGVK